MWPLWYRRFRDDQARIPLRARRSAAGAATRPAPAAEPTCGRPMKSRPRERRPQRLHTTPSFRNPEAGVYPTSATPPEAQARPLPTSSGLSGTRRPAAPIRNTVLEAMRRSRLRRRAGPVLTFKWRRRRRASGTIGRREAARIAMGIRPARSRPLAVSLRFRPATARALTEGVAKAVLSLSEGTRRSASSSWNLTPRSAGACRVATTSQSVGEPRLTGMPIAAGRMARSAFLIWRPGEVVAPESPTLRKALALANPKSLSRA
jgi:hypothetical protein